VRQAVLLLAHGAPERIEDVESYLSYVRGGKPVSQHVIDEVKQRYAEIGGSSLLLAWTRRQAQALEQALETKVYFAMRNWHPFISEIMRQIDADGIDR